MKKIIRFLNSIPYDKQLHFLYGEQIFFACFCVGMTICYFFPKSQGFLPIWQIGCLALFFTIIFGFFKETQDVKMDTKDALATALGGAVCYVKVVGVIYIVAALAERFIF